MEKDLNQELEEAREKIKRLEETITYVREAKTPISELRVEPNGGNLALVGSTHQTANLTHHSFGQLTRMIGTPANYLRSLNPQLAAECANQGLAKIERGSDNKVNLLIHSNGSLLVRSINTDSYDRVWNHEVVAKISQRLGDAGWRVPPARPARPGQKGTRKATEADILPNQGDFGLAVKVGDDIAPAGLYASDHDMFAFLVNEADPLTDGQHLLNRGVFIQNSEVGDCALKFKLFVYDNVCGNHIVWNVSNVTNISIRHVKAKALVNGRTMQNALTQWQVLSNTLPSSDQMSNDIRKAQEKVIAAKKEDVLDAVFSFARSKSLLSLGKKVIESGYAIAERNPRYGNPNTVWAVVNGLTEFSQTNKFTDERTDLDVQAGRIMEMAF